MLYKVIIAISAVVLAIISWQGFIIDRLESKNRELTAMIAVANDNLAYAQGTISAQNSKIKQYAVDSQAAYDSYQLELSRLRIDGERGRAEVMQALVVDDSCESRIALIDEELRGFLWDE
ncbi:MAG: hypothetical protein LBV09_07070 [Deferribacteraceae bacterium]|jgi:type II secretory pathway pseudopilin PulG|nr:hypothetical protein [Deferribacteraceae bacterium]